MTSFLQKCIGISLVCATLLFGTAAIIFSIQPAKADIPAVGAASGKIMMHETAFVKGSTILYHILVWDTETGKSKLYNFVPSNSSFKSTSYQLPSSPLY